MSQNTSTPTADTRKFSSLRNGISEFLGNMTGYDSVDINLTGSFRGKIYFQTSKFENDGYTTIHEFTGADLESHTFTEDDINSRLLTSEDFAWDVSPIVEVILKKK